MRNLLLLTLIGLALSPSLSAQIVSGGSHRSFVVSGNSSTVSSSSTPAFSSDSLSEKERREAVEDIFATVPKKLPSAKKKSTPKPASNSLEGWSVDMESANYCGACLTWERIELPHMEVSVTKVAPFSGQSIPRFHIVDPSGKVRTSFSYVSASTLNQAIRKLSGSSLQESGRKTEIRKPDLEFRSVTPARTRYWNGRAYDPSRYRRCGDPNCPMCNWIMGGVSVEPYRETVTVERSESPGDVPYELREVPDEVLTAMLRRASPSQGEILADIGCGKGKILIQAVRDYGVYGIGVEIDSKRVEQARVAVREAGLEDRIRIIEGDAAEFDPEKYGVSLMTAYLYSETLEELEPVLKKAPVLLTPFHRVPGLPMTYDEEGFWIYRRT